MTVHLIKLSVGTQCVDDLSAWQQSRLALARRAGHGQRLVHKTRQRPNKAADLLKGGSIYWVIKGVVQARQALIGFEDDTKDDRKCCALVLDPTLVLVQPVPRRPFQGWRYLSADDAPRDLSLKDAHSLTQMPEQMRRKLLELALL